MENQAKAKSVKFIFVTIVLEMMGIGLIIPVLPDVIRRFVSTEQEINHYFGYFVATYALMQFFASPILGGLSDKYGRRPVLLSSLFGAALDYMFMAFAPTLKLLFVGRIISGMTGAAVTVANSYMADISDDTNRAANFGLIGAAFGIGFVVGPLLGGFLGHVDPVAPFVGAACLNFLNFLFGYFILPESLDEAHRREPDYQKLNPLSSLSKLIDQKHLIGFVIVYGLIFLAGQVHPSIWTLYTEYKFGWKPLQVGLSLSVVGIVFGFSQAILTKKLVAKWGEIKSLQVGMFCNAIGFLLFAAVTQGWMTYFVIAGTCLSGMANPCLQSLMTKQVEPNRQGELQGGLVSITSITCIIAPLLYSNAFNWATHAGFKMDLSGLPYLIAAAIVFAGWILLFMTLNKSDAKQVNAVL
jgi:DHA1 family tetracycline resistance protein-like MFS transporter